MHFSHMWHVKHYIHTSVNDYSGFLQTPRDISSISCGNQKPGIFNPSQTICTRDRGNRKEAF